MLHSSQSSVFSFVTPDVVLHALVSVFSKEVRHQVRKSYESKTEKGHAMRQIVLLCLIVSLALPVIAQEDQEDDESDDSLPLVIYVENRDIYAWEDGETRLIVEADAIQAYLSPDGTQIAFRDNVPALWRVTESGDVEMLFDDAPVGQVAWADSDTLYFNTATFDDVAYWAKDDLYVWRDGAIEQLLPPGGRGVFSLSPDGETVVIMRSGVYDETPGTISLYAEGELREVLTFDAVSSGSHTPYYPQVQWVDADTFYVALPHPDTIYNELSGSPLATALWRVDGGDAVQIGAVQAGFFTQPIWSANAMAYAERSDSENYTLYRAEPDGTTPVAIATINQADYIAPVWAGEALIYVDGDGLYLFENGDSRLLYTGNIVGSFRYVYTDGVIFRTFTDGAFSLHYLSLTTGNSFVITSAPYSGPFETPSA